MKTNRLANLVRIVLLCMTLALVVMLMMIPWLAKGISNIIGNPVGPDKLDIRPVPVPVPPPAFVNNEPAMLATPAPSLVVARVPEVVPVPTPPASVAETASSIAQASMSGPSTPLMIPTVNRQGTIAMALTFIILLISVWLHRLPGLHSLNGKNAS